jgi:class 3 adenylate cyclase
MTVDAACGSCGTGLRENANFCDECGAPTAVSGETPEYKQVTVLFADVVRSMDVAATVDLERLREIMTELVERSAAVVQRYGGKAEYNGDGVMAIFGAPVALEDHAFRACMAALAIQEETDQLAAQVAHQDGVDLRVRVGLDSGRVIAGDIGSGSLGYAANRWPRRCRERGGTAGHRQEPGGPRDGDAGVRSRGRGVLDLLRVTRT